MAEIEDILRRIEALERQDGVLGRAVDHLREALVVTSEIQRRQAQVQRTQAERIAEHEALFKRIETNLAEISDKLNGLIGYMNNLRRETPPPPA